MITFDNISKQYGEKILFENVTFSINEKHRTSLIGPNGSGKTTLLKLIQNIEQPDKGSIQFPSGMTTGWLPQEVETLDEQTPLDVVLEPFKHLLQYEQTLGEVADSISRGDTNAFSRLDELEKNMAHHNGFALKARAEMILCGLGVPQDFWEKPLSNLSGGYRMRAVLGRLLLQSPDFMLLDEPTNHLDMDSLIWLEKFLYRYKGGMLIVSHDRDFLNRLSTHTADIKSHSVRIYSGNYDQCMKAKTEQETADRNRTKNLELKIAQNERFIERFKAKASKATQAQSRAKLLENLKAEMPVSEAQQKTIHFTFTCSGESGAVPLRLKNCSTGYGDKTVLDNLTLEIRRGEKVAIIGPNGAGKSTLLKLFAGMLQPSSGIMQLGHNTVLRYFGQHQLEQLNGENTLYDTVAAASANREKNYIRNALGAFLFSGDSVEKQVKVLSGGEKSRLVLASIMASPGNVLLLDEPTNHLDISSIEALSESMAAYSGTILFVSHDEYFISRLATRIIEVRPGLVRDFPGSLTDYRYYLETLFGQPEEETGNKKERTTDSRLHGNDGADLRVNGGKEDRVKGREQRKKLEREALKLEQEIERQETKIVLQESILNDPANALNHELLQSSSTLLTQLKAELDELMDRWLTVTQNQ
ncbi:MAG: ABC-F family ATP-binding cassette domain-containing protein [Chitinispirillales bacterium]|jgi:ATP-binding cassette subfamily F protein 3|nr:ABC-F family ATP-binding cassette domain-containing protein [Chitinispirillales bacterium]